MDIPVVIVVLIAHAYLGRRLPHVAIFTSLPACAAMVTVGVVCESALGVGLSLLIFPVALLAIVSEPARPNAWQAPRTVAKAMLIVLGCLVGLFAAGPVGPGMFVLVALIALVVRFYRVSREALALHVISTIGSCMKQNLPLARALASAAGDWTDRQAETLRRISTRLAEGDSLGESIRLGYPRCPGRALGMIDAAERIDQVPKAIEVLRVDLGKRSREDALVRPVNALYAILVAVFALCMLIGLGTFILPKFESIFRSFGTRMPEITRLVMASAMHSAPWFWLCVGLPALVLVVLSVYAKFRPRRPDGPHILSVIGDWIKWHTPVTRWFERGDSMSQVLAVLRMSLDSGCTLDQAIRAATVLDLNQAVRDQVVQWLARVERGENVAGAARASGLGSSLAWALDEKVNPANAPAVLRALEELHRSRRSYLTNVARSVLWPLVMIALSILVGFVVVAVALPMSAIIASAGQPVLP